MGTSFVMVFPWNNGDISHPPVMRIHIANANNETVKVTITYNQIIYKTDGSSLQEKHVEHLVVKERSGEEARFFAPFLMVGGGFLRSPY